MHRERERTTTGYMYMYMYVMHGLRELEPELELEILIIMRIEVEIWAQVRACVYMSIRTYLSQYRIYCLKLMDICLLVLNVGTDIER